MILFAQHATRGQRVAAASTPALAAGVRLDMPLVEAKALCSPGRMPPLPSAAEPTRKTTDSQPRSPGPGCHISEHDPQQDRIRLLELARLCEQFSPVVGLEEDVQIEREYGFAADRPLPGGPQTLDRSSPATGPLPANLLRQPTGPAGILLDVTGISPLFGDEPRMAQQVCRFFAELGYFCHAAMAPTALMAGAAARYLPELRDMHQLPSPPATQPNAQHPSPSTAPRLIIAAGNRLLDCPASQFYQLPVAALQLPWPTLDVLHQLGLTRLNQLLQIPRAALHSRFGSLPSKQLDLASGVTAEVLNTLRRPVEFKAETDLEYPLSDCETIEVILQRLVSQLYRQSADRQQGAVGWAFSLRPPPRAQTQTATPASPLDFRVDLFQPAGSVTQVMQLVRLQLQRCHFRFQKAWAGRNSARPLAPLDEQRNRNDQRSNHEQNQVGRSGSAGRAGTRSARRRQAARLIDDFCFQSFQAEITCCVPLVQRQLLLFDSSAPDQTDGGPDAWGESRHSERQSQLAHLFNHLSNQLGAAHVVRAWHTPTAAAEHAVHYLPLVGHWARPSAPATATSPTTARSAGKKMVAPQHAYPRRHSATAMPTRPLERPLQLLTTPLPLQPLGPDRRPQAHRQLVPPGGVHRSNYCPQLFQCRQETWQLSRMWGPERIETRWWDAATTRRNYWRIELSDGRWMWIFLELNSLNWYWHGLF